MKKVVLLLAVILLILGNAIAQKKNVAIARTKIEAENPDFRGAREAILLALKDPSTSNLANTWFLAGEVFNATLLDQKKPNFKGDPAFKAESLSNAFNFYLKADSLDQLPDAKGKVKPKYRKKIINSLINIQSDFAEAIKFYYEDQKNPKKALVMCQNYLMYPNIPALAGRGLDKDSLIPRITYFAGVMATDAKMPAISSKYIEIIKDNSQFDTKWCYQRLCEDYSALNDTSNLLKMYKLGTQKFPQDSYFVTNLINFYITRERLNEALGWITKALEIDPKNYTFWNVKGRIEESQKKLDAAIISFTKATEVDPNSAEGFGNLGRVLYNRSLVEFDEISKIKDAKKYKVEKDRMKLVFAVPRQNLEKARALNPKEREYVLGLRGLYYILEMDKEFNQMDALLKTMK